MTSQLKPHLQAAVNSRDDLRDYLLRGARPREKWGIGVEMEKLVLDAATGEAAPFDRIEELLRRLEGLGDWRGVRENGRLVALQGPSSSITLEPGGQLELSGELCDDLHCCRRGYEAYIREIVATGEALGLDFFGLGAQPFTALERIGWLPKSRYGIMGPYMLKTGDMGQRMMKQTAGVQVNLDFSDELDCLEKMRLGMALTPFLYALFANSPLLEDRPTGYLSTRGEIWSRTDPDRTGLIERLFAEGANLADYVEYALDVPMYFIHRNGDYLDMTGERRSFRRYLDEGFAGYRAVLGDWDLHLSTLFTEVRLRPQIEVRSADSLPPRLSLSVGALLKGLLYDRESCEGAWDLLGRFSPEERQELIRQSRRLGLRTPLGGETLREGALAVIALARAGLARQGCRDALGRDETIFLDELHGIVESGVTLAERLLALWQGSRDDKLMVLREHCGFSV